MSDRPKLFLIDGSSYLFRAFYAIGHLSNSKGLPTNATYGFIQMLLKVLKEHRPDYLAVIFDSKAPTFRSEVYKEYKANRPAMPETLSPQIPYIKKIIEGFGVSPEQVVEVMGLSGDAVDNIPGVPGIGEKTAIQLIKRYGSIENLLAHVEEIPQKKLKENLKIHGDLARLSKQLATIHTDVPVHSQLKDFSLST